MITDVRIRNNSSDGLSRDIAGITVGFGDFAVIRVSDYFIEISADQSIAEWAVVSSLPDEETVVDVKEFGAAGDGITDDTTSIQNAIDFISSIGGGRIHIPSGVFVVTGVFVPTGIDISGNGDASIIRLMDGLQTAAIWVNGDGCSVRDLKVVG